MKNFFRNAAVAVYESRGWWNPWKTIRDLRRQLRVSETLRGGLQARADKTAEDLLQEAQTLRGKIYALTAALSRHELDQQAKAAKKPRKRSRRSL